MSNNGVKHLDDDNFASELTKHDVVLVDFYADWCGPCRVIAPVVEELAKKMEGKSVLVAKVNIEDAQHVTASYDVTSIPTVIIFSKGKEHKRAVGVQNLAAYEKMISAAL